MLIRIPPKYAVAEVIGSIKGKSAIAVARQFGGRQRNFHGGLLLDSRVVDLPMACNPTFVILSSLKPLFFNSLQNELPFSDNVGASDPGIQ